LLRKPGTHEQSETKLIFVLLVSRLPGFLIVIVFHLLRSEPLIMASSLKPENTQALLARLRAANLSFTVENPGDGAGRQPVHSVYGGAQIFKFDTAQKMGAVALKFMRDYFPDAATMARVLNIQVKPEQVYARVVAKLEREPVEDFRIDFEDGYGNRPDAEEDADAERCALEVAKGMAEGTLPPFIGIRIKTFSDELIARSMRTLPKVNIPEQVSTCAELLAQIEDANQLARRTLKMEIMIETTQAIISPAGIMPMRALVKAADGRCIGVHFGTYDYTASCDITAAYQSMTHPACQFAHDVMKVSLAGTGIMLSDGATSIMPVPKYRAAEGETLTAEQLAENATIVHAASKLHYDQARNSMLNAFYQGWDLHPAQLPTRYAAVTAFFLEGLDAASARLKNFVSKFAQATLVGDVFDDAATGQALLNYFLRGLSCGAVTEEETLATGLTLAELRGKSFVKLVAGRRAKATAV
jgi:hypothetical protein